MFTQLRKFKLILIFLLPIFYCAEAYSACTGLNLNFTVNGTGCGIPRNYSFTNTSTGFNAAGAIYYWRLNSNANYYASTTGTGTGSSVVINTPGVDTIWLVGQLAGCRDSVFQVLTTSTSANTIFDPSTGTFNFSPLWENCILLLAQPDSFRISLLSSATLNNYRIIWGDGFQDSGASLTPPAFRTHNYTALGTYTVRIISQNGSCYDTIMGTVVNERIPTAGIIGPPAGGNVGCTPHTVRFINNSYNVSANTNFRWTFGDGSQVILPSSTATDTIFHTYTAGLCNGTVAVEAFNACGSSTATWQPIFINDRNTPSFTVNTSNCDPALPFTFVNTSTNNYCTPAARYFYWDFGDGTNTGWINTTFPQSHQFPNPGAYTVRLIDSNLCGSDTFVYPIVINFRPNTGFIYSTNNGCGPLSVIVTDTTRGVGNVRSWNFGNGIFSNDTTDTAYYVTPGTYTIRLIISNVCGSVSQDIPVTVWSPPDADFSSITSGCSPLNVSFTNNSTFFHDSTVTFLWDFGDGTTSTARHPPPKVYDTARTYTVRLYVYDTCGVDSMVRTFTVRPKPEADFSATTVCQGVPTAFTNTSSVSSGSINFRSWRFGNPSLGTSSSTNPTFTFGSADTFDVRLIVRTATFNCLDTITKQVIVQANPDASWAVSPNDTVCIGSAQSFNGTAVPNAGMITAYRWTFSNGTFSNQEDTVTTYASPGNYSVKFTVTNSVGCRDSAIGNIVVLPLPTIAMSADTACVGSITNFTDNSSVTPGSIASRQWDLNNDGMFDSITANTTFVYNSLGTKTIRLRATSNFGCQNTDSFQIQVHPLPVPLFAVDSTTICMGDSITLTNTSTGAVSYVYDFGDGTAPLVRNNQNPVRKAFANHGMYTIRMMAYTNRGCIDSSQLVVTVRPRPIAQFSVNRQIACAPFNFQFNNTSINSSIYTWFADGGVTTANMNRPDTMIMADSQSIVIMLVAENNFSCPNDTAELTIGTSRNPVAEFATNPDSGCGPLLVAFDNNSLYASSFYWDFNNGTNGSAEDTSVRFQPALVNDTTYRIELFAFNWQGCPDSVTHDIVVHPNPVVDFTQTNTDSCGPLTVSFANTSVHNAGGTISDMTFAWDFDNGVNTTARDTTVRFVADPLNDKVYNIRLIGRSIYGCPDTATKTVRVYPNPTASFTQTRLDSCGPLGVLFTNTSDPNDTGSINIMTFAWDLGNGVTSTTRNPSGVYPPSLVQDSLYSITLIAFSEHGCPDTAVSTVRTFPKPLAAFAQSDTAGCGPLTVTFTNLSIPYDTGDISMMTFAWDFGNGITSSARDTSVRFISAPSNDTVYTVRLIAYSEHGCADTFVSQVLVYPGPVAQFTVNRQIACAPFNFQFTNTSFNSATYRWMYNGSVTHAAMVRPDTLVLLDTQAFRVGLIAESNTGCPNDTFQMDIGTSRNPVAEFVTNPDSGCGPLSVAFGNTSLYASGFFWNFGNGVSSSAADTTVRFVAASVNDSSYSIKLYAFNWQGCPDSIVHDIVVHPDPLVNFSQTNTDSCGPLSVSFVNTSLHHAGGNISNMNFRWDFGNGVTSSARDTVVRFTAHPTNDIVYQVRLIGQSRYGCPDTATSTVRVYPNPNASFTQSRVDSCGPLGVLFTNTSSPNDTGSINIMSFAWDFGNGATSNSRNPSSVFQPSLVRDSIYQVRLIAFSEHGCPDTAVSVVRTYPKPLAAFTQSDTSGCGPLLVNFTNTSTPYDTGSINIMHFSWNFGNGITSTSRDNAVSFVAAALNDTVYTVRLIAESEHGCLDTFYSTVRVHPKPSVSLAKSDSTGCDPVTVNFTGNGVNVGTYHWNFGDGSTASVQNPTHDFRSQPFFDTTYRIALQGESPYGCLSDSIFTTVTVSGGPLAAFSVIPDSVCATTTSQMINNSLGAFFYTWDFGTGDTSNIPSPAALFPLNPTADTTYEVRLVAINSAGCVDTALGYVVVSPVPTADFTLDIDSGCGPLIVQFTDQSQFASIYSWSFSNGQSSAQEDPQVTFGNTGIVDSVFTARLIVTNLGGCTDTAQRQVRVYPKPTINFVTSPAAGCGNLNVAFANQSVPNDTGTINNMTFLWDFDNGSSSTVRNPNVSFVRSSVQDSIYEVKLIGISEHGCRDSLTKPVQVFPRPRASFTQSDTAGCGPLIVSFNNTSVPYDTGTIDMMSFQWNFGNGFISFDRNDTVIFYPSATQDTVYTIRLIALSEHGCRDTIYSTVRVHPAPLVSFVQTPVSGCGPLTVNFTGTVQNASTLNWNFGNGATSNILNPVSVFNNKPGFDTVYTIRFSGLSPFGCPSDTFERSVTVRPDPVADFVKSTDSICGSTNIFFTNQSSGANSFTWTFGDGGTSVSSNPQHTFAMNSLRDTTYTVRLIASNFYGCRDTALGSVTIWPFPTAVINSNVLNGCTPLPVTFGHNALLSVAYRWDFGNGQQDTAQNPTTTYNNSSTNDQLYASKLVVTSNRGCKDSTTRLIRVFPLPTAEFTATPDNGCGNLGVSFVNQSTPNDTGTINIMNFAWDLGNGQTSTTRNPATNYARSLTQDSVYSVRLIGVSEHGCRDTITKPVQVFPKPRASFTQSDTSGCGPLSVTFHNTSIPYDTGNINIMNFQWNYGNGYSSLAQDETVTFYPSLTQDTVYTIRLISFSEHGCRDTAYSTVRVHPTPRVAYTENITSGCSPLDVNFTSTTLNAQTLHWDFDNGNTSSAANPSQRFFGRPDFDTVYTVMFWAQSAFGCWSDTVRHDITVRHDPVANFVKSTDSICGSTNIFLTNQSTGANTYLWSFGDGGTTSSANPQHVFAMNPLRDTTYTVRLIASNFYSCRDTVFGSVTIWPFPTAVITSNVVNGCTPLPVSFGHNSLLSVAYRWDFGNSQTDTAQNPATTYINPTLSDQVFSSKLVVTSNRGCKDSTTRSIRVFPLPTTNFTASPDNGCGNLGVSFTNISTPNDTGTINIMTFAWDLGNGQTSTTPNPATNYARSLTQDSIYSVRLIGVSEHGCRDTITKPVQVFPKPRASFTQSDTSGCGPLSVTFHNTSIPYDTGSINIMNFQWNYGNGYSSLAQDETVTFYPSLTQDTVYTIRLISFSEHGCRDTAYSTVRVHPDPRVAYTLTPANGCGPLPVSFSSTTQNVATYYWDFGDGVTSSTANPSHTFANQPNFDILYNVDFWAVSPYGCWSDTITRTVTVHPDPIAAFIKSTDSICGSTNIFLTNQTTGANNFTWSFGDGGTSVAANPQHVFAMNPLGDTTYTVRLVAGNFYGCRDTAFGSVTIWPFPTAVITSNVVNGCTPLPVNFGHNSLLSVAYRWDFGNSQTDTAQTPTTTFTNNTFSDQVYSGKLVVTSNHGCKDSTTRSIRVFPLPTAEFTATPDNGCGNLGVSFVNQSTPNDTGTINIMTFAWDLGNGQTSTTLNPATNYARSLTQDSIYSVRLIGVSEHGCRDTITKPVQVFPKPRASFTQSDTSGCGPLHVTFNNTSIPYDTGSINIMNFQWNYGNGYSSLAQDETVTFYPSLTQDTVYTIRLISFSEHGCRDTAYSTVRVHPDPRVAYTLTPADGCGPLPVSFSSTTQNVATYYWDFGDGVTSSTANPSHTFANQPNFDILYNVDFWAVSPYGCWSDTITRTVTVHPDPIAAFIKSTDSICGSTNIFLTNQTTGANNFTWSFGDGGTSVAANPQHVFAMNPLSDTTYTVRLVAGNFYGCRDTAFGSVTIWPFPTAVITSNVVNGCTPLPVNFGHNSLLSVAYRWDFGNSQTDTAQTPTTTFTNNTFSDQVYSSKLIVTSNHGCKDSTTRSIRVFPLPTAEFTATPDNGCGNLGVSFNNQSTPNDTGTINIMTFAWDLGNGQTSTTLNPATNYARSLTQDSIFSVRLIGVSEHGCRDTITKPVQVFPKPRASFTQSDTSGCGPLSVTFHNTSIPYDTGSINIMNFQWNYGNGYSSLAQDETVTFYPSLTQDTVYTIRLISFSEHGCRDTAYSTVRVHPDPRVAYTLTPANGCGPLPVSFSSTTQNVATYYWDFADGATSSVANPAHVFDNRPELDTAYRVSFWAVSPYGCWSDTVRNTVTVRPDPVADFLQNKDSLCNGGSVHFSNISRNGNTYEWDFGDGSARSTLVNPSNSFAPDPAGDILYNVRLVATSIYGCRDTVIKPTTIFPLPVPQIINAPDSGCTHLQVNLGNNSLLAESHFWWFGDGDTASGDTVTHIFVNQLGINRDFEVVQMAISNHGCVNYDTVSIRVHPLPRPNFVFSKQGVCDTSLYEFTNVSAGGVSYVWTFGDGAGTIQTSPTHIYPTAVTSDTTFTAKLYATSSYGCVDSISRQVVVTPIMIARAATNSAGGCSPLSVNFQNLSTNASSFYWEFDDGFVSVQPAPSHVFINPDPTNKVFNVKLVVSNVYGCSDTTIVPITLLPNIDALYVYNKTGRCDVAEFTFQNQSAGATSYIWDFGDGSSSTLTNPTHIFPASLTQDTFFTVRLVARNVNGCTDTFRLSVRINPLVIARFTVDDTAACTYLLSRFTNQSRNARFFIWDFDDGVGSAQVNPTHPYTQVGTYQPFLIAFDAYGCSDTFVLPANVQVHETPNANFIPTPTVLTLPLNTFQFQDLSISSLPLVYEWNFGDPGSGSSNTSVLSNPSHAYNDSGSYLVRLIIDNGNCRDTIFRTVRVEYYRPIASFDQDPDSGCMPLTVTFTNESRYADSYLWYFGDGGTSTDENPVHTYVNPGEYTVTLIARGAGGVDDSTKIDVISVKQTPLANFYTNPVVAWIPNTTFTFVNTSLEATSYRWTIFGPQGFGAESTDPNPIMDLPEEGEYRVILIATNEWGCADTMDKPSYIRVNLDGVVLTPDGFTPNGDGTNDTFRPVFEGVEKEGYNFRVYNRWGELIFETDDIDQAWDGKFQGVMCESEVYVWQVQGRFYGNQKFQEKGRVFLIK